MRARRCSAMSWMSSALSSLPSISCDAKKPAAAIPRPPVSVPTTNDPIPAAAAMAWLLNFASLFRSSVVWMISFIKLASSKSSVHVNSRSPLWAKENAYGSCVLSARARAGERVMAQMRQVERICFMRAFIC